MDDMMPGKGKQRGRGSKKILPAEGQQVVPAYPSEADGAFSGFFDGKIEKPCPAPAGRGRGRGRGRGDKDLGVPAKAARGISSIG